MDSPPRSPFRFLRGAIVNLLSLLVFLFLLPRENLAESSRFPVGLSIVLLVSLLAEPVITYLKMDAVLSRIPDWANRNSRKFLLNLFMLLLLWGARLAFFGAMAITALKSLFHGDELKPYLLPIVILFVVREAFIVGCYCRTESRNSVKPVAEWLLDLSLVFLIAFAETLAYGIFKILRVSKIEFPEIFYMLLFQMMFFVMFFLPIRMPYTIEELGSQSRDRSGYLFLAISFLLCFAGLFYGRLLFR